jgi:hemerythrin-like domain-containing protein
MNTSNTLQGANGESAAPLHQAADSARRMSGRVMRAAAGPITPYITTMIQIDHTHVLALFRRLRPWTSPSRKQAIVANACLALEIHAELEEEIFYPALQRALGSNEVLQKSVPEHNEMRELVGKLRSMDPQDPDFDGTVHSLMGTVLHHVADEESILLPQAEALLGDELIDLGLQMTQRRAQLLRPHIKEVLVTTARSFPVLTAAVGLGALALSWALIKPARRP